MTRQESFAQAWEALREDYRRAQKREVARLEKVREAIKAIEESYIETNLKEVVLPILELELPRPPVTMLFGQYACPKCGISIRPDYEGQTRSRCTRCGQTISWESIENKNWEENRECQN